MDIKVLDYFLEICREGSYNRAAKNVFISPQGLNKAIRALEQELGTVLFDKTTAGLVLTNAGSLFYDYAIAGKRDYECMLRQVKNLTQHEKYQLKVGFSYGTLGAIGIELVKKFTTDYPDIDLQIEEYPDLICDEKLKKGEIDLGFTVAPFVQDGISTVKIKTERHYFWVSTENPISKYKRIYMKDLINQTIATIGRQFKTNTYFPQACNEAGITPNIVYTSSEMSFLKQLAIENKAISLTVEHDVLSSANDSRIAALLFEPVSWSIGLSCFASRQREAPIRTFTEYLTEYVKLL